MTLNTHITTAGQTERRRFYRPVERGTAEGPLSDDTIVIRSPAAHRKQPRHGETVGASSYGNVLVCSAASGGIGLSVLASMIAWELAKRGRGCALVDADFLAGGLDVLLGIEHEPGVRFSSVQAPLGHIEGSALNQELPVWAGVHVLAYDPWNGDAPAWWEIQAAVQALAAVNDAVVVDAGPGPVSQGIQELTGARQIVAVELSVLGLARAKTHIARITNVTPPDSQTRAEPLVVGVHPRGATRARRLLDVDEASEYLGHHVIGPVRHHGKLQYEVLEGLGITSVVKSSRSAVDSVVDNVERLLPHGNTVGNAGVNTVEKDSR